MKPPRDLLLFIILTFAATWLLQLAVIAGLVPMPAHLLVLALAGVAPSLVAIVLTRKRGQPVRTLFGPPGRIPGSLLVLALLMQPALTGMAAAIYMGLGNAAPMVMVTPMMLGAMLIAPLGEELGWRGFAQVQLIPRLGALGASLAVGAIWALWHLPTAFFPGASGLDFLLYAVRVMAFSVIIGCLFERAGRRTLVAVAAHLGVNATVLHLPAEPLAHAIWTAVFVAAGITAARFFPASRRSSTALDRSTSPQVGA
jgi:uncharacterized protein